MFYEKSKVTVLLSGRAWIAVLSLIASVFFLPVPAFCQTGSVTGTLTTSDTSLPITSSSMVLRSVDFSGPPANAQVTNGGVYTFSNVADGQYYVNTGFAERLGVSYVDKAYGGVVCVSAVCDYSAAGKVTVSGGAAVTGINFVLTPAASISGHVTDGTSPLPGHDLVTLFSATGAQISTRYTTKADGSFSFAGIPSGNYYLTAGNDAGYKTQLYSHIPCTNGAGFGCTVIHGTPVVVTAPTPAASIDFALTQGASITGTVTDHETGQPISNAILRLYNLAGDSAGNSNTFLAGNYALSGLADGKYYVTAGGVGYKTQLYKGMNCGEDCKPLKGTQLSASGTQDGAADFSLRLLPTATAPDLRGKLKLKKTGKTSAVTVTVINSGTAAAGAFDVRLYLSASSILKKNATAFQTLPVVSLAAGAQTVVTGSAAHNKRKPFLIVVIDGGHTVSERSEKNNTLKREVP